MPFQSRPLRLVAVTIAAISLTPMTAGLNPDVLNYAWRDYGNRVGVWARVRLGPFANRSDALSKVRELTARGQTSFIASARD